MATLTIKNLPRTIHLGLKKKAITHHRSLNSEVIFCLQQAVVQPERSPVATRLQKIRRFRESLSIRLPGPEELTKIKRRGLP